MGVFPELLRRSDTPRNSHLSPLYVLQGTSLPSVSLVMPVAADCFLSHSYLPSTLALVESLEWRPPRRCVSNLLTPCSRSRKPASHQAALSIIRARADRLAEGPVGSRCCVDTCGSALFDK